MASIFITGSNDGLGRDAARRLLAGGHTVVGHARSQAKADALREQLPEIDDVLIADLASQGQVRQLAADANAWGTFDAVIHNAGVYLESSRRKTEDGHAHVLAVNVLAPFALTALMHRPQRLIYLTSGLLQGGTTDVDDLDWVRRRWSPGQAYSDSKLIDATLAAALARRWPDVIATSVSPGWVATKMGGPGATDDYEAGSITQAWLAVSDDPAALQSGAYFFHQERQQLPAAAEDPEFQDAVVAELERLTGIALPAA